MPSSDEAVKFEVIDLSSISRVDGEGVRQVQSLKPADSQDFLSHFEMQDIKSILNLDVKPMGKDSGFSLNPVVKQHLNLDVEEKLAIEEEVREKVKSEILKIKDAAKKEAYDLGYKEGLEDAKKEIFDTEAPQREKFRKVLEDLSSVRGEVVEANKKFFTDIVYRVVRYILLRELHQDNDYIVRLATHLVERQDCKDDVRVFLSPSDYHRAVEIDDAISKAVGKMKNLSVDVDEHLQPGNCRLETKNGIVESDINKQIHEVAKCMGMEDNGIVPLDMNSFESITAVEKSEVEDSQDVSEDKDEEGSDENK